MHIPRPMAAVAGIVVLLATLPAPAAIATHTFAANAVHNCQAFTPGPANTIRNRVVGSENIGATMAVACDFQSMSNGATSASPPQSVTMWFSNNNAGGTLTVTCTLLTSFQGSASAYLVTKTTVPIDAGGTTQRSLTWNAADNPVGGATDLGNSLVGINCTLPTGAVINDTYLTWSMDNGV